MLVILMLLKKLLLLLMIIVKLNYSDILLLLNALLIMNIKGIQIMLLIVDFVNNKHVITVGGNDKAIFQFKFEFGNEAEEEAEDIQNLADADDLYEDDEEDVPTKSLIPKKLKISKQMN